MGLDVMPIEQERFRPFGRVLEPLPGERPRAAPAGVCEFFVLTEESGEGWRIGFLRHVARTVDRLERHPNTKEAFIPLSGQAVLILATDPTGDDDAEGGIAAFRLDKPVILDRGVWHGVVSLSPRSDILIAESGVVADEFHDLRRPIDERELCLGAGPPRR